MHYPTDVAPANPGTRYKGPVPLKVTQGRYGTHWWAPRLWISGTPKLTLLEKRIRILAPTVIVDEPLSVQVQILPTLGMTLRSIFSGCSKVFCTCGLYPPQHVL